MPPGYSRVPPGRKGVESAVNPALKTLGLSRSSLRDAGEGRRSATWRWKRWACFGCPFGTRTNGSSRQPRVENDGLISFIPARRKRRAPTGDPAPKQRRVCFVRLSGTPEAAGRGVPEGRASLAQRFIAGMQTPPCFFASRRDARGWPGASSPCPIASDLSSGDRAARY